MQRGHRPQRRPDRLPLLPAPALALAYLHLVARVSVTAVPFCIVFLLLDSAGQHRRLLPPNSSIQPRHCDRQGFSEPATPPVNPFNTTRAPNHHIHHLLHRLFGNLVRGTHFLHRRAIPTTSTRPSLVSTVPSRIGRKARDLFTPLPPSPCSLHPYPCIVSSALFVQSLRLFFPCHPLFDYVSDGYPLSVR